MEYPFKEEFLNNMKALLGEEYDDFMSSYDEPRTYSLRVNNLKGEGVEKLLKETFCLSPVEWADEGFYFDVKTDDKNLPGKHVFQDMGLYYIQDASAMLPAVWLDPKPGDKVLDLCAAPGGKSTQIASRMKGEGILVSNEPVPNRAKALSENIARMGIRNAVVLNEYPDRISRVFQGYFDRILVDSPCSGEGMFRRIPEARLEWSPAEVELCATRDDEILDEAYKMLKVGGILVYSTCTFEVVENEGAIERFLERHPEMSLEKQHRIWPHKQKGEGHFVAKLVKTDGDEECKVKEWKVPAFKDNGIFEKFEKALLTNTLEGSLLRVKDNLYLLPEGCPDVGKLKLQKAGVLLGEYKKDRFEPNHDFALFLDRKDLKNPVDLHLSDETKSQYISGMTIPCDEVDGYRVVCLEGCPLGWGKAVGGTLKNHYPKRLRF